ncbi:MAG: hypothetical protein M3R68_07955 [Acidobacteriota bacterium]|nr:hypothetical protein [Acidobacteriota bacterium]
MADEHLATYLNDHLAGSVLALELLEHLESTHAHSWLRHFFSQLHAEVATDRDVLEGFMDALKISQSRTRKASAWLAEKMTELKLRIDDPQGGPLRLFESLEALSLGIEGKRSLWIALRAAAEKSPELRIIDYERLIERADEQRARVEKVRIDTAREALTPAEPAAGTG